MGDLSDDIAEMLEEIKWDAMRKAHNADYWLKGDEFIRNVQTHVKHKIPLDFGDVVYAPRRQSGKKLAEAFIEIDRVREDLRACGLTGADARLRDAITKIKYELRNG